MAPKGRKPVSLGLILRRICLRAPQKFTPSLVSDIYPRVVAPADLDDLLASDYLERVLWRFFHGDVSNSYLELLMEIVAFEFDVYGRSSCLSFLISEQSKAEQLMLRLLLSTMTRNESTYKLEAKFYIFLRVVVMEKPKLLVENTKYPKWIELVTLRFCGKVMGQADLSKEYEMVQCFLLFCMWASASYHVALSHQINSHVFPTYFRNADNGLVRWLAENILLKHNDDDGAKFLDLQIALKSQGFLHLIPSAQSAPLLYDIDPEALTNELCSLSKSVLQEIVTDSNYIGPERSNQVLAAVVCCLALGSRLDWGILHDLDESNEGTIFDIFEKNSLVLHMPDPIPPIDSPSGFSHLNQIKSRRTLFLRREINRLAVASLSRLEFTNQGIKGSSKYFSKIDKVVPKGSLATISGISEQVKKLLSKGDRVLLLELHMPNKFGGQTRITKYGLLSCRLGTVTKNDSVLEIFRSLPEYDQRFNAIITLSSLKLSCVPPTASSSLLNFKTIQNLNGSYKQYHGDLPDIFNPQALVKLECELEKEKKPGCTTLRAHLPPPPPPIVEQELCKLESMKKILPISEITKHIATRLLTTIDPYPLSESITCIEEFLKSYKASNGNHGKVVIVVPSRAAVALFPLFQHLTPEIYKYDSENESVFRALARIKKNLLQVSMLANHLSLSEYDFGGSIKNALMLYDLYIVPKWNRYLESISESGFFTYPFETFPEASLKDYKMAVSEHYHNLCCLFADLEKSIYFDKFPGDNLTLSDIAKLNSFLSKRAELSIVSHEDIGRVPVGAETIFTYDVQALPAVDRSLKRLIVFGNSYKNLNVLSFEKKILPKAIELPGFAYSCQKITVPPSNEQANVEEAKYCLNLYFYMRKIGYPRCNVLVVCSSPYTKLLMEELYQEQSKNIAIEAPVIQMVNEMFFSDISIISTHGHFSTAHYYHALQCTQSGLFFVGSDKIEPFAIHTGKLELFISEWFEEKVDRRRSTGLRINDSEQLAKQVEKKKNEIGEIDEI